MAGRQERESMSRFELLLPKPIGMGVSVAECSIPASNGRWPRSASIVGRGGEGEAARHRHHVPPVGCGVSFFSVGVEGAWGGYGVSRRRKSLKSQEEVVVFFFVFVSLLCPFR
jgi:hypothetical protein